MILVSIARRYARALFEVAGDRYEAIGTQLSALASALEGSREATAIFANPSVPLELKRRVIEAAIAEGGIDPLLANALRLMNDRGRIPYLGQVARVFNTMVDERAGRIRARITSAHPLPPDVERNLAEALSRATNRIVQMESGVDRELLGGVVAQVGNVLYDGSLRTQLEQLRRELGQSAETKIARA